MKEPYDFHNPNLLGVAEQIKRLRPLRQAMEQADMRAALVSSPVSIYYLTGRIYRGYLYITVDNDAPLYLVRRPTILHGPGVHLIAKPSEINETLAKAGMAVGEPVALELDTMPCHDAMRLAQALGMEAPKGNISPLLRACRAVKTEREKDMLRRSGIKHAEVYSRIPGLLQYSAKMANDCLAGTTRLYYCIQSNVLCQCFFKKMCFLFFRQAAARAESPLPRLCRTIACSIQKLPYIQHPPALLIPGKPQIRSRILQLSLTLFICHTGKFLKEQS